MGEVVEQRAGARFASSPPRASPTTFGSIVYHVHNLLLPGVVVSCKCKAQQGELGCKLNSLDCSWALTFGIQHNVYAGGEKPAPKSLCGLLSLKAP